MVISKKWIEDLLISTEQLAYLDFDYALAGHFHSNFIMKPYQKSTDSKKNWFIYPGSPVKITFKN